MSFSLIAKKGSKHIEHQIHTEYTTVGRSKDADISLPAEWSLASSIHLEIKNSNSIYYIKDGFNGKKSTNGTQLNNTFISSEKWTMR
jgi:pSer/pThr/pTyr-binding forkhead associated (FHA) protein